MGHGGMEMVVKFILLFHWLSNALISLSMMQVHIRKYRDKKRFLCSGSIVGQGTVQCLHLKVGLTGTFFGWLLHFYKLIFF